MDKRETVLKIVRERYPECQVADTERAVLLVPPVDGRYGTLVLEVPMWAPTSSYDERALFREITLRMDGLTRALPDIGRQTLDALSFSERVRGTVWEGMHLETFLRFGIMTDANEAANPYRSSQRSALKIVPPLYATDVQVILRTRSNAELETLADLMRQTEGYTHQDWTYSYERVQGYNHVFGTVRIARDLVAIRDEMEKYWQLVNGSWSNGRAQRQYVNRWMSGVDFR